MTDSRICIALDFQNKEEVKEFLEKFNDEKLYVKVGMELFYGEGIEMIKMFKEMGHNIFLDLKLHDIPNTVKSAMKQLAKLDVDMVNVHASGSKAMMKAALGDVVKAHPWTYAVMLLLISKFVNSQAAALVAFVPLALGIGVDPAVILAFASACYGYYILPTYPSDLAAIQFDRSGTTHIGKFVINHSFILPGLIGVITSCIFGYIFTSLFGYL